MDYLMEKATNLKHFQVYGANLVSNDTWKAFFVHNGSKLETLKLSWLDASFDDEAVASMVENCPNLRRLKLKYCRRLTAASLEHIARLRKLVHLSLHFAYSPDSATVIPLINTLGPQLETLSLENFFEADDTIIEAVRANCTVLSKFRLTDLDCVTDAAFEALFSPPSPTSPTPPPQLTFLDLSNTRDIDNNNPLGPEDQPVGLASAGFTALMSHSSSRLHTLRIASCRHISHAAFCDAFRVGVSYPELREMDISFCNSVDTSVLLGIFRTCPTLRRLVAFGCFKVEDVVVPKGLILVGLPRAQDQIEQVGDGAGRTHAGGMGLGGDGDGVGTWEMVDEMMDARTRAVEVGA